MISVIRSNSYLDEKVEALESEDVTREAESNDKGASESSDDEENDDDDADEDGNTERCVCAPRENDADAYRLNAHFHSLFKAVILV